MGSLLVEVAADDVEQLLHGILVQRAQVFFYRRPSVCGRPWPSARPWPQGHRRSGALTACRPSRFPGHARWSGPNFSGVEPCKQLLLLGTVCIAAPERAGRHHTSFLAMARDPLRLNARLRCAPRSLQLKAPFLSLKKHTYGDLYVRRRAAGIWASMLPLEGPAQPWSIS